MNCRDVVDVLYEYLDRELDETVEREIREHLAACGHCFALHHFEEVYRQFLEARTRAQAAPAALRRRILEQLLQGPDSEPA
jgi:anti-sigma factor (TIGR02949 family)